MHHKLHYNWETIAVANLLFVMCSASFVNSGRGAHKINLTMQFGTVMVVCRWIPFKNHESTFLNRFEPNRAATPNRMNRTPNRNEPNRRLICMDTDVHQCVLICTNVLAMSNFDERRQPLLFSSCYNGFIAGSSQALSTRIVTEQTTGWPQNRTVVMHINHETDGQQSNNENRRQPTSHESSKNM